MIDRRPTDVSVALDALARNRQFVTFSRLKLETKLPSNRLAAALHHLVFYNVAMVLEIGGVAHYLATPSRDTRIRVLESIKVGITRNRKSGPTRRPAQASPCAF